MTFRLLPKSGSTLKSSRPSVPTQEKNLARQKLGAWYLYFPMFWIAWFFWEKMCDPAPKQLVELAAAVVLSSLQLKMYNQGILLLIFSHVNFSQKFCTTESWHHLCQARFFHPFVASEHFIVSSHLHKHTLLFDPLFFRIFAPIFGADFAPPPRQLQTDGGVF